MKLVAHVPLHALSNLYFKFIWFEVTHTPRESPCLARGFVVLGLDRFCDGRRKMRFGFFQFGENWKTATRGEARPASATAYGRITTASTKTNIGILRLRCSQSAVSNFAQDDDYL
jgi:hypothetical protein